MTTKDINRLTIKEFNQSYRYYQDDFDLEHSLINANKTYAYLRKKQRQDDDWDFD